jgi:tetratricopeptide (TPR) repeat protein
MPTSSPSEASGPPGTAPSIERGQTINRFVVVALVGRGGMGEVYSAYDPELDRKVAIKLLRVRGGSTDGRGRLLREAQATARLSHPNVVVVYDVGTFGNDVFVAMEFVAGGTLGFWMHAAPRSWRDVLKVFLPAGRGLAAAHAAGLVHRDFKPDNVMLTSDGQVRVMDFGLARAIGEAVAPAGAAPPAAVPPTPQVVDLDATTDLQKTGSAAALASTGNYLSLKLTQTGAMLGTPAYMAPEQFASRPADARSDQFSFCVALYEALYGERPFAGDTFNVLLASVSTGIVRPPPAKSKVPGWLRRIVLRGLETDPDRRYPSMEALLTALRTDPTVRTRRVAAGLATAFCLAATAFAARHVAGTQARMCEGAADRLAGVWEPGKESTSPRKQAVHRAFQATGKSYADQAFQGVSRLLDQYAARWSGLHTQTCEATHVRGEQSAEVLDLRMACLQERLTSLRALTDVLSTADGRVVENAVPAAEALPSLDRCSDVPLLKAVVRPPEDAATRARVESLRKQLARFVALRDAGHCSDASAMSTSLLADVRAAGYQPLLAEALSAVSFLGNDCGDHTPALAGFREAYVTALASRHDEIAATAAILLAGMLADRARDTRAAREWLTVANAMLQRIGGNPLLHTWSLTSEAALLTVEGKGAEAVAVSERSLAEKRRILGADSCDVGIQLLNQGNALEYAGRYEEALAATTTSRAMLVRILGPEHPRVGMVTSNQAEQLLLLGRYPEARASYENALSLWRRAGTDPLFLSVAQLGLGLSYLGEGTPALAIPPLEAALRIRVEKNADPERMAEVRFALARALWPNADARPRARELVRLARNDLSGTKPTGASLATVAQIDAWQVEVARER